MNAHNIRDGSGPVRTWIFQANPAKYRIFDSLTAEAEEYWNLNQYATDVTIGDRVLIWVCGVAAGIYAVATVVAGPTVMPDIPTGMGYWIAKKDGRQAKPRVLVRYRHSLADRPLRRVYLEAIPALWNLRILNFPRGTNFPVTESEWAAIEELLNAVGVLPVIAPLI